MRKKPKAKTIQSRLIDKAARKAKTEDATITRDQFHALVKKAAQPVEPSAPDLASDETSGSQTCDDCNETNTH